MSNFNISRVVGGCGVLNFYDFGPGSGNNPKTLDLKLLKYTYPSAGWAIATFRELVASDKKMYEALKEKFPIVYQSSLRLNKNSGNNFFFCIYDLGE